MAAYHSRSNSFPSREHPLIPEFNEQLSRLRSSEEASSSSTSITSKLSGLQDLHDCVEQMLLLPLNQQALSKELAKKWVDELLDGSLRILDVCSTAKDALTQTKESAQELQSILRRSRRSGEMALTSEINKFLASRKLVKKELNKAMGKRFNFSSQLNENQESVEIVRMLREVESITLTVSDSLLSFISGPKSQAKSSGWSLVSKMMNAKRVACNDDSEPNEFESADAALKLLISTKKSDSSFEDNAQKKLQNLEMCIQDLEEGFESLYRRLIKSRVSLLNILTH